MRGSSVPSVPWGHGDDWNHEMRTITVDLGERSYPVHIGRGVLEKLAVLLPDLPLAKSLVVISDEGVGGIYGDRVERLLEGRFDQVLRVGVPPGETSKSLEAAGRVLEVMAASRIRRGDLVLALGGGMVTDLAGFVASIYQRGVAVVHVPTTLLGQVDAAIGGKTGVNLGAGKNLAGTFHQPRAVIADVSLLATLPAAEFRSGMAEVTKYGFCFDPPLLERLGDAASGDPMLLEEIVGRSVEHKAKFVAADEFDAGMRLKLNYGHTLGHALEAYGAYRRWTHGEAIAIGMVFAAALAEEAGVAGVPLLARHVEVLTGLGLPVRDDFDRNEVLRFLEADKKHAGSMRWVLLKQIGETVVESGIEEEAIHRAFDRVTA